MPAMKVALPLAATAGLFALLASSSTAAPMRTSPADMWSSWVRSENAQLGSADGFIDKAHGDAPGLEAFADRISVRPGETVGLYINTASRRAVAVRALRLGYYSGRGLREIWRATVTARPQPAARIWVKPLADAGGAFGTRAVYAPWTMSAAIRTDGWPEGMYVLRLDAGSASRYVLITLRSGDAQGRLLLVDAPMTYQAYNLWGGRNLYGDRRKLFSQRSYAVSFNRPYSDGFGSGRFMTYMMPLLRQAERAGLPLAWATDYDIARDPSLLAGATGIVLPGHLEYVTAVMRDALVARVRGGANLAAFGANTAYWRVRLAGGASAAATNRARADGSPRYIFAPKRAALDPLAGADPAGATARFRDAPRPREESELTGMRYTCFPALADWVVSDAAWWGYAGTGVRRGARLPGVIGPESDVLTKGGKPPAAQVVAYSKLRCGRRTVAHTGVYWSNAAGAGVFAVGTMNWVRSMTKEPAGPIVRGITDNVLRAFAKPRAGRAQPAIDNTSGFDLPAH